MLAKSVSRCTLWSMVWLPGVGLLCGVTRAQTSDKPIFGVGEVTVNDLYVRSGDSQNHYTITKLKAGERVTIVGQRGDWYEILPPAGTFSLISGDFVDTADDRTGVVNGNNVRVRAGSLLNQNKYTVQVQLSRGTEVTILSRNPDGFLRIKPPKGATVWVHREYVQIVPENRLVSEQDTSSVIPVGSNVFRLDRDRGNSSVDSIDPSSTVPRDDSITVTEQTSTGMDTDISKKVEVSPGTAFAGLPRTDQRIALDVIDAAARAEASRPMFQRQWTPLIQRYRAIADEDEDKLAARYAQKRIDQINDMAALVDTVRKMRKLNETAESKRREAMEGRSTMQEVVPPQPSGLDARGELRVSALYPPGTIPRRFRLVHTTPEGERTIGYVEIPEGSSLAVNAFLGRYIGVRASSKRLQEGSVEPIPIFVAKELVLLEPDESDDSPSD